MKRLQLVIALIGLSIISNAQLSANIQTVQPPSSNGACDGWVHIYISSGTAPYTYIWDDLDTTSGDPILPEYDTLWNVCPGVYDFTVVDATNDTVFLSLYFPSNGYTWSSGGSASDTIYRMIDDCSIDYGIPVDTAYLDTMYYVDVDTLGVDDSLYTAWAVVQGSLTTIVEDTFYVQNGSSLLMDIAILCNNRAEATVIQIQHVKPAALTIGEYNGLSLSIKLFPNPSNGLFRVEMQNPSTEKITSLKVFGTDGRLINQIPTNGRPVIPMNLDVDSGIYYVIAVNARGEVKGSQKIVIQ